MSLTQLITLVATVLTGGWLSAFVTQLIKREHWPSKVKLALSLAIAAIVGLASAWLSGDVTHLVSMWGSLTADSVLSFCALVYAAAATWYRFYFRDAEWAKDLARWPTGG